VLRTPSLEYLGLTSTATSKRSITTSTDYRSIEVARFMRYTGVRLSCATLEEFSTVVPSRGMITCILPHGRINISRSHSGQDASRSLAIIVCDCTRTAWSPILFQQALKVELPSSGTHSGTHVRHLPELGTSVIVARNIMTGLVSH
jgi:hypothetical protein